MWNSAYMHKSIIYRFIKTRHTNQTFIFMNSKVVYLKKPFAFFFCHEMPRISTTQSCLQREQWGSQSRHTWKTSLEICYFDVFEKLVKVTRKNKASQNLLYIIEINLWTDIRLAVIFLQIWACTAGYLRSHKIIHIILETSINV